MLTRLRNLFVSHFQQMAEEPRHDGRQGAERAAARWGHTGRMMLTWPLKASHCAPDKHTVRVHYLCYDLGEKADIFSEQQGLTYSQHAAEVRTGQ